MKAQAFWPSTYNRGDLEATLRAALEMERRTGATFYVFATALGFGIHRNPPAFRQGFYTVKAGRVKLTSTAWI